MTKRRMILDCDPGHDDAIALLYALAQPDWTVEGVTVVAGNSTLEHTVRAAGQVLSVAGRTGVPYRAGAAAPLVRALRTAPHVHGESGLAGPELPDPLMPPAPGHAVDWLCATLGAARDEGRRVELAGTGPLTNIAQVLQRDPGLTSALERIVVMGGALAEGNITPAAEFNIFVDPEAAAIVFDAEVPVTMIGLDVTHRAIFPRHRFEELRALGTPVGRLAAELLDYFLEFHARVYGFDGVPIHDACAVAALHDPALVTTRPLRVDVETASQFCDGRTVIDRWSVTGREPNVEVALDLDVERFFDRLVAAIASYPPG